MVKAVNVVERQKAEKVIVRPFHRGGKPYYYKPQLSMGCMIAALNNLAGYELVVAKGGWFSLNRVCAEMFREWGEREKHCDRTGNYTINCVEQFFTKCCANLRIIRKFKDEKRKVAVEVDKLLNLLNKKGLTEVLVTIRMEVKGKGKGKDEKECYGHHTVALRDGQVYDSLNKEHEAMDFNAWVSFCDKLFKKKPVVHSIHTLEFY